MKTDMQEHGKMVKEINISPKINVDAHQGFIYSL